MAKRQIKIEEQERLFALLRKHCSVREDGYAAYEGEWNDANIASAIAPDLSVSSVITARRSLIGILRAAPSAGASALERRIEVLEVHVQRILHMIGASNAGDAEH